VTDLIVLVPTRLRPHAVIELSTAFAETCTADTGLVFCVDDCPRFEEYWQAHRDTAAVFGQQSILDGPRRRLVGTLNHYGTIIANAEHAPFAIAYMGDDHRPITHGWDTAYLKALREQHTGIVYGNDEIQGENLCTQVAITTDIIATLGFVAPPVLTHLYCDNFWLDLGRGADCIQYLPDVIITHRHPSTGAVAWDESYLESNSAERYAADQAAYHAYVQDGLAAAIAAVNTLKAAHP
jgi:hypothetical protein